MIWRSGTSISLYRGVAYEVPQPAKTPYHNAQGTGSNSLNRTSYKPSLVPAELDRPSTRDSNRHLSTAIQKEREKQSPPEIKYETEIDKLLDELGPRYTDWPGCDPLPVDADLLPGIVPGYKPPFRILPYGVKPSIGQKDGTALRRLARTLPPHFALGKYNLYFLLLLFFSLFLFHS